VTPGGQAILNLVDFFGGGFIIFALGKPIFFFIESLVLQSADPFCSVSAIIEVLALAWIYGMNRFCR
jgi:hypothetical protein